MVNYPATFVSDFHDAKSVGRMDYRHLGTTDMVVSKLALGGGPLGGIYGSVSDPAEVVSLSLKGGVNYIDTAPWYGQGRSEEALGKALADIPRSAYYIGTKVGRYELEPQNMFDFRAERVESSIDESLAKLGLPAVDVIQIHDVEFADSEKLILEETLPALQRIVEKGKARFIGITGYPLQTLKSIVEKSTVHISTILTYCRATIFDQTFADYASFFSKAGVGVINASTTGIGLLVPGGPQDWHPGTPEIKVAAARAMAADVSEMGFADVREAALLYGLNFPGIATTLCGANTAPIARQNLDSALAHYSAEKAAQVESVRAAFFPGPSAHWEGVEVAKYRQQVNTNVLLP